MSDIYMFDKIVSAIRNLIFHIKIYYMKHFIPKLLLLLPLFFLQNLSFAQAPNWEWVKSIGNAEYCHNAVDAYGNIYLTGRFSSSTLTVGSFTLTNSSAGTDDIFLIKYDASGNIIWAKSAGGNDLDYPTSIAIDNTGNIYVVGLFKSPVIYFGSYLMTNSGIVDPFIAKYDAAGNIIWTRQGVGNDDDAALAVTTDASGNVFVSGEFHSSTITFEAIALFHTSSADAFVVKYDGSGNAIWARSSGGDGEEQAYNIAVDAGGNVFITGYFNSSSVTFGNITLNRSAGYADMFLVKYDASGNEMWAKNSLGSHYDANGDGLVTDLSGNVFVSGLFDGSIMFGNATLTSQGGQDVYIVKFSSSGNVLWTNSIGGAGNEGQFSFKCLAIDPLNNIYITGEFISSNLTVGIFNLTNSGVSDIFLAKYDASGNVVWAKQVGGSNVDDAYDIIYRPEGIYLSGIVRTPVSFGTIQIPQGGFLAKLSNCATINAGNPAMVYYGYPPQQCTMLSGSTTGLTAPYSYLWNTGETTASITVCPTANTNYSLTISAANGCRTTDFIVNVVDVRCGKNLDKVSLCHLPGTSKQKQLCVAQSEVSIHLGHGDKLGTCVSSFNLLSDGQTNSTNRNNTGYKLESDAAIDLNLKAIPNPSNNYFTLKIESDNNEQKINLQVLDLQGKLVENKSNLSANQTLQLGRSYLPGVYIAQIIQGNRRRLVKLVKM